MNQILSSWKEIAVFLGKGVRTVQRWEQQLGLPIHRPAGAPQNIVIAHSEELLAWLNSSVPSPRKSVLYVEDDVMQRSLVQSFLEMSGYDVIACEHAKACLEHLESGLRADLVLTDMYMSEMTGLELTEHLQSAQPGLPVILLSSDSSCGEKLAEVKGGCYFFLHKPFGFPELKMVLEKCLDIRSSILKENVLTFPPPADKQAFKAS